MKHIVFDLDGTLVDSALLISDVLNEMRQVNNLPPLSLKTYRRFISNGAHDLIQNSLECHSSDVGRFLKLFRSNYSMRGTAESDLFPDVRETLMTLSENGFRMAICSNKPEALCCEVLSGAGISNFFESVVGGDSLGVAKPHPKPLLKAAEAFGSHEFIFIGDSTVDQKTAAAADVKFGFFAAGYDDGVDKNACTFIFSEMRDLYLSLSTISKSISCGANV